MCAVTHLDAAAGLPLHPAAREALLAALDDGWADPSRLYGSARRARRLLDESRSAVSAALSARPDEVRFTPSLTHALYDGVRGVAAARARSGRHVVHSAVEHSAVLHACAELDATSVAVNRFGRVSVDDFASAVQPDTVLGCLLAGSHEVGTTQPVAEVAARVGVPLLVDASQAVGRVPVPEGWSLLACAAPQWGGPAVGVLAVRTGVRWLSPWPEEPGPEVGVVPLPEVLAAAVALQSVLATRDEQAARQRRLVDRIRATAAALPDCEVVGDPVDRLPHLVTFSLLYLDGEALVRALDAEGFAVGSGSSCTSSTLEPSHVLVAMGALSHGNVRVSLWSGVSDEEVERFCSVLPGVVARLRAEAGVDGL